MMIPVPGTTVVCVAGEPLDTAALPAGKATRTALLEELERRLDETCRMADRIAGRVEEGT
jgi:hypothetical protein